MPLTHFPQGIYAVPLVGANLVDTFQGTSYSNTKDPNGGNIYFVDGDNGNNANSGHSPQDAKKTIAGALAVSQPGAVIYITTRDELAGAVDPTNYAETVIIGPTQANTKLIGVGTGVTQGAQPQIKKGSGAVAAITVRAPGCLIYGLTINMAGTTGAGILLDDDGATKSAFGTVIQDCVFKGNANKSNLAGAIAWASTGGGWQVKVKGCHFFDNTTGINILGTSQSVPKNIVIEDCLFFADAANIIDADVNFNVGNGAVSVLIRNCEFATVDVPQIGTPNTARYLDLTQVTNGALVGCRFACVGKTFGATGNAAKIPTTVRIAGCSQEVAAGANATGEIGRT